MFRTKKSILLLPLASLAIFAVTFGIAFMDHRYSNDHGSVILTYVVALYFFCCACSVVSGVFAVRQKADRLPLLAWIAKIILYLTVIITFADIANLIFSGVPIGADKINMFFVFVITLLCFTAPAIQSVVTDRHLALFIYRKITIFGLPFKTRFLAGAVFRSLRLFLPFSEKPYEEHWIFIPG